VVLPPRPRLEGLPDDPGVNGVVTERRTIELTISDAIILKRYIESLRYTNQINVIILEGHIEKLENRIKALAGSSPN
jgi:hypothetical protein